MLCDRESMVDLREKKMELLVEARKGDKAPEESGTTRRSLSPKLR